MAGVGGALYPRVLMLSLIVVEGLVLAKGTGMWGHASHQRGEAEAEHRDAGMTRLGT